MLRRVMDRSPSCPRRVSWLFASMAMIFWWAVDLAGEYLGYGVCPFADDPVKAARRALQDRIRAQPLALESLDIALSSWHYSQQSDRPEPLVVALTGSTGTGKSETAWVLADAILTKDCRISGGTKDTPRGLLVLNGQDYMAESKLEEYQSKIRRKLGERLEYCGGNVVVLFDELQKITPGTLNALTEAMSEHPRVAFERGGRNVYVDSSRVVFLLVSDIGADSVLLEMMKYQKRSDVPPGPLQGAIKRSLDEQWERLRFGKMVDKVVPYLPMDHASNVLVVELKLKELSETLEGGLYTTSGLRRHLVQPSYIEYGSYHITLPNGGGDEQTQHRFATYGARDVEKVSMRRLRGVMRNHVLNPTCAATDEGAEETGSPAGGGMAGGGPPGQGGDRCWSEPFMVDIRHDASTEQVSFHRCEADYADDLTELQREHPDVVKGAKCELAWRGLLHEHGTFA